MGRRAPDRARMARQESGRPGLDPTMARLAIAKSLRWLGKNDEAWQRSRLPSRAVKAVPCREAARLLSIAARKTRPLKLAQACLQRYPFTNSVISMAEIHWCQRQPEAAAALIANSPVPNPGHGLPDHRQEFANVFAKSKIPGQRKLQGSS